MTGTESRRTSETGGGTGLNVEPLTVPSGLPGIDLVHFPVSMSDEAISPKDLPVDGAWSATISGRNIGMQRHPFRTLHAAMHYAMRVADLFDWTGPPPDPKFDTWDRLAKAMNHAEAHAHEVDACWPAGSVIVFENGPSIVDNSGSERLFLAQAPLIEWEKGDDGRHRCRACGTEPVFLYDWMSE